MKQVNGTFYEPETPEMVIHYLERYRGTEQRVRVFYGDTVTGEDWLEEHDTIGYVSRSTGRQPCPLLVRNSRSLGGSAILDHRIVKITVDKQTVYQHPNYHLPELAIVEDNEAWAYPATVTTNGLEHARFRSRKQAERFISFLKGERNSK